MNSLVYEANARMRDPVYGCVGAISYLQNQVSQLQTQLALAQAEILSIKLQQQQQQQQQIQQQATELMPNQQMMLQQIVAVVDEDDEKEKSCFVNGSNYNLSYLQQYLNFAASAATASVIQDPPISKREFLWT